MALFSKPWWRHVFWNLKPSRKVSIWCVLLKSITFQGANVEQGQISYEITQVSMLRFWHLSRNFDRTSADRFVFAAFTPHKLSWVFRKLVHTLIPFSALDLLIYVCTATFSLPHVVVDIIYNSRLGYTITTILTRVERKESEKDSRTIRARRTTSRSNCIIYVVRVRLHMEQNKKCKRAPRFSAPDVSNFSTHRVGWILRMRNTCGTIYLGLVNVFARKFTLALQFFRVRVL